MRQGAGAGLAAALRRQAGVADRAAALAAGVAQLLWLWALPTEPPTAELEARLSAPVLLGPSSEASSALGARLLQLMINCLLRLRLPHSVFRNEWCGVLWPLCEIECPLR